jgi:predicted ATPase/DNA-binding SARP family transcriptional activator
VLGPLEVTGAEGLTPIAGARERAVLAALAVRVGEVVMTEQLIDAVWGERPARSGLKVLHNVVLRLRKVLGADVIGTRPGGYVLVAPPDSVDACRFERLVQDGRARAASGDWEAAEAALSAAVALWRGLPLRELGDWPPAQREATRLQELRRCVEEEWAEAGLACGHDPAWIAPLEMMVSEEPLRERRWSLLMLALYRSGRQADALRAFQRARAVLAEIGVEPSPDLIALERAISVHDEALAANGRTGASPSARLSKHRGTVRRHNLPAGLTRFVGRAAELAEVQRLLGSSRLLTVTGVGGAGKTRLALEAAAGASGRYPDGVWLLELAPLSDEAVILSPLTATLGITLSGADSPGDVEDVVCSYLASRHVLLIFDNCEHLVDAVADLVQSLLTRCPGLSVLATSRELLGLPGEVSFLVPPMSLPSSDQADMTAILASDAVTLFCERIEAARPDFRLTAQNATAVAGICRRLDGIPLALELAAARVRMLSVEQIVDRLDDCFRLLTGGARTLVPRHQTLRAALDWSYDLLSAGEQAALRQLAVFPDRFDVDAAAAVMAVGEPAAAPALDGLDVLARLLDKSLVVAERAGEVNRYRLLEPVRQYVMDKLLEAGELEEARRRHRDFFLMRATAFRSEFYVNVELRRNLDDLGNYRAALEWSWRRGDIEAALQLLVAHFPIMFWAGYPDALAWLERVLAEPEPAEHRARAVELSRLALVLHDSRQSDRQREERLLRDAVAMSRRLGDWDAIAFTSWAFGEHQVVSGNTAEARSLLEDALEACERSDTPSGVGWCHCSLGWVAVAEQNQEQARAHFDRAALIAAQTDSDDGLLRAHALAALAPLTALLDDPERGLDQAEVALGNARDIGLPAVLMMALSGAAETAVLGGAHARATEVLEELLKVVRDQPGFRWVADALEMAALVLESRDESAAATEALASADALRVAAGETGGGVRVAGAEVQRARDRLPGLLGAERFAKHDARGRTRSPDAAIADALARLGDRDCSVDGGSG